MGMCPPGTIGPAVNASGEVVIAVVPPRVVKEIRSRAETVAVDHPSWSLGVKKRCSNSITLEFFFNQLLLTFLLHMLSHQVLIWSLDSEENHH